MRTTSILVRHAFVAILLGLVLFTTVAATGAIRSVGGTVEDARKALIPGVTITATNIQTVLKPKRLPTIPEAIISPLCLPGPTRSKPTARLQFQNGIWY
jgi:hypothetical protein